MLPRNYCVDLEKTTWRMPSCTTPAARRKYHECQSYYGSRQPHYLSGVSRSAYAGLNLYRAACYYDAPLPGVDKYLIFTHACPRPTHRCEYGPGDDPFR